MPTRSGWAWRIRRRPRRPRAWLPLSCCGSMHSSPAGSATERKPANACWSIDCSIRPSIATLPRRPREGLHHRLALPHAEVVPVGADERQPLALGHVGVDADDRDARLDRPVDDRDQRAGSQPTTIMPAGRRAAVCSIAATKPGNVHRVRAGDRHS